MAQFQGVDRLQNPQILVRDLTGKVRNLLSRKAVQATVWITSAMALQKIIQFVSNLILTRIMFPEAFGIMSLCWTVMVGLGMLSDVGLRPAILSSARGHEPAFMDTAWTIQLLRGALMFFGAAACSVPFALLYGQPELTGILILVSTTSAFQTMRPITLLVAERDMRVHYEIIVETVSQVLTLVITVVLAYKLRSTYALAYGAVIGGLISLALAWKIAPKHRHRLMFDPDSIKEIKHFSGWVFLSTAFTFLGNQGSRLIQGIVLSVAQLGILTVAQTIASIPAEIAQRIATGVAHPIMAKANRDQSTDNRAVISKLHGQYVLSLFVAYAPIWVIAPKLITIIYDSRYWDAAHYLQLLCINAMAANMRNIYTSSFLAMGGVRKAFAVQFVSAISNSLGIVIGFHFGGVDGLIHGMTAGAFLTYVVVSIECYKEKIINYYADIMFWLAIFLLTWFTI